MVRPYALENRHVVETHQMQRGINVDIYFNACHVHTYECVQYDSNYLRRCSTLHVKSWYNFFVTMNIDSSAWYCVRRIVLVTMAQIHCWYGIWFQITEHYRPSTWGYLRAVWSHNMICRTIRAIWWSRTIRKWWAAGVLKRIAVLASGQCDCLNDLYDCHIKPACQKLEWYIIRAYITASASRLVTTGCRIIWLIKSCPVRINVKNITTGWSHGISKVTIIEKFLVLVYDVVF